VDDVGEAIEDLARTTGFSGVVRVDEDGGPRYVGAFGAADRRFDVPITPNTRFGTASAVKGFTALTVVSLIEDGDLTFDTTARSLLGDDLPLISDEVTVAHLLEHCSGIGDHWDEEDPDLDFSDYVLPVPVHALVATDDYLPVLAPLPPKFPPGTRFSYCNAGYVVLALLAERATGRDFHGLVLERVCEPAGLRDTAWLRSDELEATAAVGYLDATGLRTNVLHLPVVGTGDGGIYTTVADVHALWGALFAGRIVSREAVADMVAPRNYDPGEKMRYGRGFWLHETRDVVVLDGCDAGVSFSTAHDPSGSCTYTVIANTTEGAWPLVRLLGDALFP
jgi:CubicO group peptidase (beta-lactamase class C family)